MVRDGNNFVCRTEKALLLGKIAMNQTTSTPGLRQVAWRGKCIEAWHDPPIAQGPKAALRRPRLNLSTIASSLLSGALTASVEHPGSGAAGILQPRFGLSFGAFANETWLTMFHLQTQWTGKGHWRGEDPLSRQAATGTIGICCSLIDRAPDVIILAAVAATEFVNRHGLGRKERGWPRQPRRQIDRGEEIRSARCPDRRCWWGLPRWHRRWGYRQCR